MKFSGNGDNKNNETDFGDILVFWGTLTCDSPKIIDQDQSFPLKRFLPLILN